MENLEKLHGEGITLRFAPDHRTVWEGELQFHPQSREITAIFPHAHSLGDLLLTLNQEQLSNLQVDLGNGYFLLIPKTQDEFVAICKGH